ncbi:MAG TPA: hypothetical protein PKE12_06305 [Kiritimatiellia bacterium]|nr:hypothetical protein [Kiritimatiellia bacterium]
MSKSKIIALVLIGLVALVAVLNHGSTSVHLLVTSVRMAESVLILGCAAVGVAIGVLIK